jgi:hypothetical protein
MAPGRKIRYRPCANVAARRWRSKRRSQRRSGRQSHLVPRGRRWAACLGSLRLLSPSATLSRHSLRPSVRCGDGSGDSPRSTVTHSVMSSSHRTSLRPAACACVRQPPQDGTLAARSTSHQCDQTRLLVIGQRIRRCPTQPAQGGVQAGQQGAEPAVPGRQHHPEPRPRQPGAEQQRRPRPAVRSEHHRAGAPVELQPQPRFGDPGPIPATVPRPPRLLGLGDRAASGPLVAGEPQRLQPPMHHIGPDRAIGTVHPLLDLAQERVDDLEPLHGSVDRPTGITGGDVPAHGLGVHPPQSVPPSGAHPVASNASRISMISL